MNNPLRAPECGVWKGCWVGSERAELGFETYLKPSEGWVGSERAELGFETVEYHTVYGVSPWITRTYLLPYSGTGMLYRTVSWVVRRFQAGKSWLLVTVLCMTAKHSASSCLTALAWSPARSTVCTPKPCVGWILVHTQRGIFWRNVTHRA